MREAYDALPEVFDDLPTVVVSDVPRPAPAPPRRPDSVRPPFEAVVQSIRAALPTAAIPWLARHRAILASASAGVIVMAGFNALHSSSHAPPSPALAAVLPPVSHPAPERVVRAVSNSRASQEVTPNALLVDDLPRDTDDESTSTAHSLAGVPTAFAPAPAQVAGGRTPAARVQPKEVHLE